MGRETFPQVRDGSGDALGGLEQVGGTPVRYATGPGTLLEVQDMSGDNPGGPGRVEGHSRRSGTGQGTIAEIRGVSGSPREDRDKSGD